MASHSSRACFEGPHPMLPPADGLDVKEAVDAIARESPVEFPYELGHSMCGAKNHAARDGRRESSARPQRLVGIVKSGEYAIGAIHAGLDGAPRRLVRRPPERAGRGDRLSRCFADGWRLAVIRGHTACDRYVGNRCP